MAKFVLIDQSITDVGGHHHEYAVRVLKAAQAQGYETVLATHRSFERDVIEPWEIHRAYRYGFWQQPLKRRWYFRPVSRLRLWWHRQKVRLVFSPIGLLWQTRREGGSVLSRMEAAGLGPVSLGLLAIPAVLGFLVIKACGLIAGLVPGAIRAYAWKFIRGLFKIVLLPLWPVVWVVKKRAGLVKALRKRLKMRAFGADTARVLARVRPGDGDIVFIPTINEVEMAGLARVLARRGPGARASWRLLFRRNLYEGRPADYARQDEYRRPERNLFHAFADATRGIDVRCSTDTDELTHQWNRLGAMAFETLPIPVDEGYHDAPGRRAPGPLRTVYAGDARDEKGFHLLPGLVRDVHKDLVATGRLRFVIQAYYNSEPGEPGARVAMSELEEFAGRGVTLVRKALSGNDYRRHVTGAEIALIPYHRDNYFARSSGIFTEAAAAGIPSLVPSGSWMAAQLEGPIHAWHAEALASTPVVLTLEGEDLGWHIEGGRGANPMHDGRLVLSGAKDRRVKVMAPPRASHVMVTFDCRMDQAQDFVGIRVRQAGTQRRVNERRWIAGGIEGRFSRLVPLEPGAREITLGFAPAYSDTMGILSNVRLTFLSSATPLAVYGAGYLYDEEKHLSEGLREVATMFEHYRTSAEAFALQWRGFHTPGRLVRALRSSATPPEPVPNTAQPAPTRAVRARGRVS